MRQEEQQGTPEQPDTVRSAPVPVRPPAEGADGERHRGDPAARTGVPEDALDERGTFDDPAVAGERSADRRAAESGGTPAYDVRERRDAEAADTDGRPEYHDPAPLPTTFGATTVGDAVAASAMASGRPEDERDPRGEDTAQPGDGAPGRTDTFDDARADPTAGDRLHSPGSAAERSGSPGGAASTVDTAGYGRAEPAMVDPDAGTAAAGAGVAGAATSGGTRPTAGTFDDSGSTRLVPRHDLEPSVPADAATLFAPEIAENFRKRWRDVQLQFVDDPRAAVGEAQSLVEEAIEALSAALREQKARLGGWQEAGASDTEQLRVAVRGYRDFLDRVLGR
ncbi:hypothetical protein [Micromonospora narathiwatensis]|uniref:Uncharacterized protein n=1 Tax=Micromonospora narathiwatensis TaxID=299146 RepID=A0A1A9A2D3_9ACTN|nr:hypothetical protein [Micromonospora narathiwatensis]SBT50245.1 hypothetical protein GA0070621_3683 [Micromonospora narathiwatensis]